MGVYGAFGAHDHTSEAIVGPESEGGESGISGLVRNFINNQGSNLVFGDVVGLDTSGDNLIKKTTLLGDMLVIGVVAKTGPFANGANTPVLISGYHSSVKVTGAIARGDYLQASNTDGSAETIATPNAGTFARVVADDVAGFAAAIVFDRTLSAAAITNFLDLTDTPDSYVGQASKAAFVKTDETGLEFLTPPSTPIPLGVLESLTGQPDGAIVAFPLLNFFLEGSTRVYADGMLMEPEIDWTEDSDFGGVTLAVAPATGTQLAVEYLVDTA
jgi:hypothetical protein